MFYIKNKTRHATKAIGNGILPALLRWRIQNGFPAEHMAATEIVNGKYIEGKFTQGDNTPKKQKENIQFVEYTPRYAPGVGSGGRCVKIVFKRSKLKSI